MRRASGLPVPLACPRRSVPVHVSDEVIRAWPARRPTSGRTRLRLLPRRSIDVFPVGSTSRSRTSCWRRSTAPAGTATPRRSSSSSRPPTYGTCGSSNRAADSAGRGIRTFVGGAGLRDIASYARRRSAGSSCRASLILTARWRSDRPGASRACLPDCWCTSGRFAKRKTSCRRPTLATWTSSLTSSGVLVSTASLPIFRICGRGVSEHTRRFTLLSGTLSGRHRPLIYSSAHELSHGIMLRYACRVCRSRAQRFASHVPVARPVTDTHSREP